MLLPVINSLLIVTLAALSYLQNQLTDPARTWVSIAHGVVLVAALVTCIVLLIIVSMAGTPTGAQTVCNLVIPCLTATPIQ